MNGTKGLGQGGHETASTHLAQVPSVHHSPLGHASSLVHAGQAVQSRFCEVISWPSQVSVSLQHVLVETHDVMPMHASPSWALPKASSQLVHVGVVFVFEKSSLCGRPHAASSHSSTGARRISRTPGQK